MRVQEVLRFFLHDGPLPKSRHQNRASKTDVKMPIDLQRMSCKFKTPVERRSWKFILMLRPAINRCMEAIALDAPAGAELQPAARDRRSLSKGSGSGSRDSDAEGHSSSQPNYHACL